MTEPPSIIEIGAGRLRGVRRGDIHRFLGVPYGASTAGANRFHAPRPVAPWSGVREALQFGPTCPQLPIKDAPLFAWYHARLDGGEDCLRLNVFTPGVKDNGKRPVMVWLHGGGFNNGAGSADVFEGTNLAAFGEVVVVTLTHRVGVFGFLHLGELGPEYADAGNAGLLDMVAALRWVSENIAEFGGDPGNVTLFGQSGGTGKICALLAMPAASGLFKKAIMQSGCALVLRTAEQAARHAHGVLAQLPGSGKAANRLRELSVEQLLAAAKLGGPRFGAVVDGDILPRHPCEPDAPAISADVSIIIGTAGQEASYFYKKDMEVLSLDDMSEVRRRLMHRLQCEATTVDGLIEVYRDGHPGAAPARLMIAIETDYLYRLKCVLYAERKSALAAAPIYMYLISWQAPAMGGLFGAPHTLCVPLVFRNAHLAETLLGTGSRTQALSDKLCSAWVAFAHRGDPNTKRLPLWPPYRLPERATMIFDDECSIASDPLAAPRQAIAALGPHANYISPVGEKYVQRSA